MIADVRTPLGTIILVFPFQYFFYCEFLDISGIIVPDNTETPAANIADKIALFQIFLFGYTGKDTVKMRGFTGILVGKRGHNVTDWLAAAGAIGRRKIHALDLQRDPFGPVKRVLLTRRFLTG